MFTKSLVLSILSFCLIIAMPTLSDDEPNYAPGEVLVRFASHRNWAS
jgi:hypothetical protein